MDMAADALAMLGKVNLVEDVIAPLARQLVHNSGLLQQVCLDPRTTDTAAIVKEYVDQLAKATTVVVAQRLGISKCLQEGVGLQDLIFHACTRSTCHISNGPSCCITDMSDNNPVPSLAQTDTWAW